jgi:hypothetical protein
MMVMKKSIFLLLLLVFVGCAPAQPQIPTETTASSGPATIAPETASSSKEPEENASFSFDDKIQTLGAFENLVAENAELNSFLIDFNDKGYYYISENAAGFFAYTDAADSYRFEIPAWSYASSKVVKKSTNEYYFSMIATNKEDLDGDNAFVFSLDFDNLSIDEIYRWKHDIPTTQLEMLNDNIVIMYPNYVENKFIYKVEALADGTANLLYSSEYDEENKSGLRLIEKLCLDDDGVALLGMYDNRINECYLIDIDYSGKLLSETKIELGGFLDLDSYYGNAMQDFIVNFYFYKDYLVLVTQHSRVQIYKNDGDEYRKIELPSEFSTPLHFSAPLQEALANSGNLYFMSAEGIINIISLDTLLIKRIQFDFDDKMAEFTPIFCRVNETEDILLFSSNWRPSDDFRHNISFFSSKALKL